VFVYVLNCHGQPLMPCQPRKARLLLKEGKAKVANMVPFTIQLLNGSSGYKQAISLGVDAGTQQIGVAATTEQKVLFEAEVLPRSDIQELLATRRQFRRARRRRKTRYRKVRFLNRKKSDGWLAPSVQHKVEAHLKTIRLVHKILPVRTTTIEVAQFDMQKIRNPEIEGKAYQEGPQLGFWNVREYVLFRDKHCCQWCRGKSTDPILNVHHIESRKTGGDSPDNLITLCEMCHDLIHRTHQEHKIARKSRTLRDATQMGIIRWRIYEQSKALFQNVHLTYGYITKHTRISHHLEKSHLIDARCISTHPCAISDGTWDMINKLQQSRADLSYYKKMQAYLKPDLLILDELGYRSMAEKTVEDFFEIITGRYEKGSLIVTTNRELEAWDKVFIDKTLTSAIVDRFLHHARIIEIKGESYRNRHRD
jgi:RRXRR protein/IstB-like ATP binding protein/HNH endonuclease